MGATVQRMIRKTLSRQVYLLHRADSGTLPRVEHVAGLLSLRPAFDLGGLLRKPTVENLGQCDPKDRAVPIALGEQGVR